MHHASRRRRRPNVLQPRGGKRLGTEIERAPQVCVKTGSGIHVLRMVGKLYDREALQSVLLPWFVELIHGGIPLPLHFALRFADLSRSGVPSFVFLTLFLIFLFAGGHELQSSARSGADVGLERYMSAIRHHEFVEVD